MATLLISEEIPADVLSQIRSIVEKIFEEGQHWVRGISPMDWRRTRYSSHRARRVVGGPSVANIIDDVEALLGYIAKPVIPELEHIHNYMIIKPENSCIKEHGIALFRPVLKKNNDGKIQLNFHIWFHSMHSGSEADHLMSGWRFEEPEGEKTIHNFYHAQPLRRFGKESSVHGMHARSPESFPTFPLNASDTVELCLNAVLVACGKEALRSLIRNSGNPEVRTAASKFWTKIFGDEAAVLSDTDIEEKKVSSGSTGRAKRDSHR